MSKRESQSGSEFSICLAAFAVLLLVGCGSVDPEDKPAKATGWDISPGGDSNLGDGGASDGIPGAAIDSDGDASGAPSNGDAEGDAEGVTGTSSLDTGGAGDSLSSDAALTGSLGDGVATCDAGLTLPGCAALAEGAFCGGGKGKCESGFCIWTTAQGRKMVYVPAGPFWMGCNNAKDNACAVDGDEYPQHEVTLSAYWLDMYEVTVADYAKCKSSGPCKDPAGTYSGCNWGKSGREQHPINCVDWLQAQTYCQWQGSGYGLPTEAQWEKAARGGCEFNGGESGCQTCMRTYPWGEASPSCDLAVFSSGGSGCGHGSTWPVGSKPKGVSPYGAHDMAGNASEWVLDWYDSGYYGKSPKNDPVNNEADSFRVYRGGGWNYPAYDLRSRDRGAGYPDNGWDHSGFRCVR